MIIFSRTIKWNLLRRSVEARVLASVNLDDQVYLDVSMGDNTQGVLLSAPQAIALGEALVRAGKGQGIPAGPHTPGTSDE